MLCAHHETLEITLLIFNCNNNLYLGDKQTPAKNVLSITGQVYQDLNYLRKREN